MRYPEGKVFSNALFALSVIEFSGKDERINPVYASYVDRCINVLISDYSTKIFPSNGVLKYGAFYNGWTNFVLNKYIKSHLFDHSGIPEKVTEYNNSITQSIVKLQQDSLQLIDTYPGSVWPGDNMACIASLDNKYADIKLDWYYKLLDSSSSDSILLDHVLGDRGEIRGSSQALCIYFLSQVDFDFAKCTNEYYTKLFVDRRLGGELVKEYLYENSYGDVDSGPIILGYGAVASIMNTKTQATLDMGNPSWTWGALNILGLPINIFGDKYYLGKKEEMFDIFMLWCSVSL